MISARQEQFLVWHHQRLELPTTRPSACSICGQVYSPSAETHILDSTTKIQDVLTILMTSLAGDANTLGSIKVEYF